MRRIILLIILFLSANCFALQKNVASQKWTVFAFDRTDNTVKTGDAANIQGAVYIDGVENGLDDANPTEMELGFYQFSLTQAETNGDYIVMVASSGTANIQVIGTPQAVWTTPANFVSFSLDSNGRVDLSKIDGNATNGNNATLYLKQLSIINNNGTAMALTSTGGNGHGFSAAGNGSGSGMAVTGGATGRGLIATGGATSGDGIFAWAQGNNDAGMELVKHGVGKDIDAGEIDDILTDTSTTLDNYVDSLESRLTAARAGYLDELAAANMPTDIEAILQDTSTTLDNYVDDLESRLTAARAGYLDDIPTILTDTAAMDTATEMGNLVFGWSLADYSSGAPSMTCTASQAITYLYGGWRNKTVTNGTDSENVEIEFYNAAGTKVMEAPISDDGTSFTRNAVGAPD